MTDAPLTVIEHAIDMNVSLERAWRTLTAPENVPRWLGCLNYERKIGHVFYMQPDAARRETGDIEGATHCEILELDEPELFRFSWYLPGTPKTHVSIRLTALDKKKTKATLTHDGWDQFNAHEIRHIWEMLENGWKSSVLPNLKRISEAA